VKADQEYRKWNVSGMTGCGHVHLARKGWQQAEELAGGTPADTAGGRSSPAEQGIRCFPRRRSSGDGVGASGSSWVDSPGKWASAEEDAFGAAGVR